MIMRAAVTMIVAALAVLWSGPARAAERIAVIVSSDDAPYKEAVGGFHEHLAKQGLQPTYEFLNLGSDPSRARATMQKVKQGGYTLIFTLGSLATDAAAREIGDLPIVAGLILRTDGLKKVPNLTGVALDLPVDVQLAWIQKILPQARTIGVVYNPEENKKKIESAAKAAQKMGLTLETQEVRSSQEVPDALARVAKRAQILWGVADSTVTSPQMARAILLFSVQNSIPVAGPSVTWARAGALYSLDSDYRDIGAQCGEMAAKVLKGAAPQTIPPETPGTVKYSLNLNAARQMKLSLPDEILHGAQQTF